MSKQQKAPPASNTQNGSKAPTHVLYHIAEKGEGQDKSYWTEIGAGWINGDGSVNIRSRTGTVLLPGESYQLRVKPEATAD